MCTWKQERLNFVVKKTRNLKMFKKNSIESLMQMSIASSICVFYAQTFSNLFLYHLCDLTISTALLNICLKLIQFKRILVTYAKYCSMTDKPPTHSIRKETFSPRTT